MAKDGANTVAGGFDKLNLGGSLSVDLGLDVIHLLTKNVGKVTVGMINLRLEPGINGGDGECTNDNGVDKGVKWHNGGDPVNNKSGNKSSDGDAELSHVENALDPVKQLFRDDHKVAGVGLQLRRANNDVAARAERRNKASVASVKELGDGLSQSHEANGDIDKLQQ